MNMLQLPCHLQETDENNLPKEMREKSIPRLITILTVYHLLYSLRVAMCYFLPGQTGASQANQALNCG